MPSHNSELGRDSQLVEPNCVASSRVESMCSVEYVRTGIRKLCQMNFMEQRKTISNMLHRIQAFSITINVDKVINKLSAISHAIKFNNCKQALCNLIFDIVGPHERKKKKKMMLKKNTQHILD